eukprot:c15752_g1_i4.p1 GENE.c15752_g1_i4~~c15752_g1_i4.p1  ORF type:complete len:233 (+),score=42.43 c15752_g1_i4:27-701(+)
MCALPSSGVHVFAPTQKKGTKNQIAAFTSKAFKSEVLMTSSSLQADLDKALKGHCIYLPSFFCGPKDFDLLQQLTQDIAAQEGEGMVNWSQHLKHENPTFSPTFQRIIARLEEYFDVEVLATRLNFYRNGLDWKPFHHDSHAYSNGKREDFTMGASFGASRELVFLHEETGAQFGFPQNNGDVFAFTSTANRMFKHGVPKASNTAIGPRFSIIAWYCALSNHCA